MLREHFFNIFFKYKQNSSQKIVRYNQNEKSDVQNQLNIKIIQIDQQISENSKALIEAQIVKLRSNFSQSKNFIEKIGQNVYKNKLEDSINWHQQQIKELYFKRKNIQITLEKIKGVFWFNQIKRFLKIIIIVFCTLLTLFIFLSSFIFIIYLMPIIILIFIGYILATKKY